LDDKDDNEAFGWTSSEKEVEGEQPHVGAAVHGGGVVVPLRRWEVEQHLATENADATAITALLADPHVVAEHLATEAQLSAKRRASWVTPRVVTPVVTNLGDTEDDDEEPVPKKPRSTHDGEPSGNGTAPVVQDISSGKEDRRHGELLRVTCN
jgi:hypothetical protein